MSPTADARCTLFTEDFSTNPYWWEASSRPAAPAGRSLPGKVDVLVVGSGYTGLHAALVTARAGRSTLVLERDVPAFAVHHHFGYGPEVKI